MELENKIINLYNQKHSYVIDRKIVRLLKFVFVDKEDDIDKIIFSVPITAKTLDKYLDEGQEILKFLTQSEFELLKNKIESLKKLKEIREKDAEIKLVENIINEVYSTRHKIEDICASNFLQHTKFKALYYNEDFMDKNFGRGTYLKVKNKIAENGVMRSRKPKDHYLVEDRLHVFYARPEVNHLSSMDFKKLSLATSYLYSGGDLQYVVQKYETSIRFVLNVLSDLNLQEILKPEYYEQLKMYIFIENNLINNNFDFRKEFFSNIIDVLYKCNLDKEIAMKYFKIPEKLFDKILKEILKAPYISVETKAGISNILNVETEKKVK